MLEGVLPHVVARATVPEEARPCACRRLAQAQHYTAHSQRGVCPAGIVQGVPVPSAAATVAAAASALVRW